MIPVSLLILLFCSTINGPTIHREWLPSSQCLALGASKLDAHIGLPVSFDWLGLLAFLSPTWRLRVRDSEPGIPRAAATKSRSFSGLSLNTWGWGITTYPLGHSKGGHPEKVKRETLFPLLAFCYSLPMCVSCSFAFLLAASICSNYTYKALYGCKVG